MGRWAWGRWRGQMGVRQVALAMGVMAGGMGR